jgi:hypothetical protein
MFVVLDNFDLDSEELDNFSIPLWSNNSVREYFSKIYNLIIPRNHSLINYNIFGNDNNVNQFDDVPISFYSKISKLRKMSLKNTYIKPLTMEGDNKASILHIEFTQYLNILPRNWNFFTDLLQCAVDNQRPTNVNERRDFCENHINMPTFFAFIPKITIIEEILDNNGDLQYQLRSYFTFTEAYPDLTYRYIDVFCENILALIHGRKPRTKILIAQNRSVSLISYPGFLNFNKGVWRSTLDEGNISESRLMANLKREDSGPINMNLVTHFISNIQQINTDKLNEIMLFLTEKQQLALVRFLTFNVYQSFISYQQNYWKPNIYDTIDMLDKTKFDALNPIHLIIDPAIKENVLKLNYHRSTNTIKLDSYNPKYHIFFAENIKLSSRQYIKYNDKKLLRELKKFCNTGSLNTLNQDFLIKFGHLYPNICSDIINKNDENAKLYNIYGIIGHQPFGQNFVVDNSLVQRR